MGNATSIALTLAAFVVCLTGLSIYTAFGPPNKQLGDPYEDHED
ncbi:MAG: photosystem II reaction center protein PsbN [Cyanobacteria bacterium M5B4]|nr:photosystem II reaction center protein PsbN [Cyanobacteria bacterium KgW148]PLS68729.1 MAG: photosystem II reaction center protein PsbN [Cyanobacteria bacterium M5B4]